MLLDDDPTTNNMSPSDVHKKGKALTKKVFLFPSSLRAFPNFIFFLGTRKTSRGEIARISQRSRYLNWSRIFLCAEGPYVFR